MNRVYGVVILTALSAGWVCGSDPFFPGAGASSALGSTETSESECSADQVAEFLKMQCLPLKSEKPLEAAEELLDRLGEIAGEINGEFELKKFFDILPELIKIYPEPLGEQKFLKSNETTLIEIVKWFKWTSSNFSSRDVFDRQSELQFSLRRSFYERVEEILIKDREARDERAVQSAQSIDKDKPAGTVMSGPGLGSSIAASGKDCDDRLTSSSASTDASVTPTAGPSPSSTLSSQQPTGSVEKKSAEIIAGDVPSILSQEVEKRSTSRSMPSHEDKGASYERDTAAPSTPSPARVEDLLGEEPRDRGWVISGRTITYVGAGIMTLLAVYFGYDLMSGSKQAGKTVAHTG